MASIEEWGSQSLSEIATVNPRKLAVSNLDPDSLVHFVPMASVEENFGGIDASALRILSEVQKGYTQFLASDVLFAKITPCMENGKGGVVPELVNEVGYGSTEFHVIRAGELVRPRWIAYFLSRIDLRKKAQRAMTGSAGQLRVPTSWLEKLQVPLPSIEYQDRILARVDELLSDLDAGVAALKRAQANLKRYRASILKAAVEGRLTADWRKANPPTETGEQLLARILKERREKWEAAQLKKFAEQGKAPPKNWQAKYVEPVAPKASELPLLPKDWCWATVACLADVGTGTTPSKGNTDYWEGGNIPWVTSSLVNNDQVVAAESFVTEIALQKTTLKLYPSGTLLLAMYGEGKTRGKVSELQISATINQALAAIVFSGVGTETRPLVKLFLDSQYEETRRKSSGGVQPNLNLGLVQEIAVPLPPLVEQKALIEECRDALSNIDSLHQLISQRLLTSAHLRQSILKAAFSGQL